MISRIFRTRSLLPLAVLALTSGVCAYADIVVDGNFEGADLGAGTGTDYFTSGESIDGGSWTVTQGTVGVDTNNFYIFDGSKSIFLNGDITGPDSLTQTLTTVVGQTYTIGFWADADVANTFSVTFGGAPVAGAPTSIAVNGFPSPNYLGNSSLFEFYSGTATATSTSTDLVFTASGFTANSSGVTVEIDNVSAIPTTSSVPEPGTLGLLSAGMLGVLSMARRKIQSRS